MKNIFILHLFKLNRFNDVWQIYKHLYLFVSIPNFEISKITISEHSHNIYKSWNLFFLLKVIKYLFHTYVCIILYLYEAYNSRVLVKFSIIQEHSISLLIANSKSIQSLQLHIIFKGKALLPTKKIYENAFGPNRDTSRCRFTIKILPHSKWISLFYYSLKFSRISNVSYTKFASEYYRILNLRLS